MDYKEKAAILLVCSSKKGERCSRCPAFGQGNRNCFKNAMRDGATAITDLLSEVAELEAKNIRLQGQVENANVACDKWERLYRAELEKKAGKPAWIRVEDRMPEDGLPSGRVQVTVLACTKAKRTIIASRVYEPERTFEYGEIKKTYPARWIWSKRMNKQVTHWMPLPDPPKEA